MKKLFTSTLIILLFFGLVFPIPQSLLNAQVTSKESKIVNVSVDPRIELLSVIQLLSDYPLLTRSNFQYKREVLNYFSPYKSLAAVQKYKEMYEKGFSTDAPPAAMLYLSDPPELKNVLPFTNFNDIVSRAGGEENLKAFIEDLRDFVVKSDFMDFFNAHKDYYSTLIKGTEANLGDCKDVSMLEDFYGTSKNNYNIIIVPLYPNGGYGAQIESEPSKYDLYCIIGPFFSEDTLRLIIWHEFSHSFINPITEQYINEVNKYLKLYSPIIGEDVSGSEAYLYWKYYVDENIVRAVVAKFNEKVIMQDLGQDVAEIIISETLLSREVENGFVYIRGIYDLLDVYEKNRDKYPTFEDFYPEILNYFSRLSQLPLLPVNFRLDSVDLVSKKIVLKWDVLSDDGDGFNIYRRKEDDEEFILIKTFDKNQKEYDDKSFEFGKTFLYKLSTFNLNGESYAVEEVKVNVPTRVVFKIGGTIFAVNSRAVILDSPPIIKDNQILLPLRAFVEVLGGEVTWDTTEKKITVTLDGKAIELWIGKSIVKVNSVQFYVDLTNQDCVPRIIKGRTMIPLRYIVEVLSCDVHWDETTKMITIYTYIS